MSFCDQSCLWSIYKISLQDFSILHESVKQRKKSFELFILIQSLNVIKYRCERWTNKVSSLIGFKDKKKCLIFLLEAATFQRSASEMVRRTLCGVVQTSNDRCDLDADDVMIISLCDTTLGDWTRIDFPHIPQRYVISTVKLEDCGYLPMPFTLYYNDEEIDPNLCYGIRCDILDKNQEVKYSSDRFIPVLTDKHPKTNINIQVVPRIIPTNIEYRHEFNW